jgi:hypothetical protein
VGWAGSPNLREMYQLLVFFGGRTLGMFSLAPKYMCIPPTHIDLARSISAPLDLWTESNRCLPKRWASFVRHYPLREDE